MRFEGKHNYFKKLAGRLGNFINVPYTMAIRHQCLSCYYSIEKQKFGDELEVGTGSPISLMDVPPCQMNGVTLTDRQQLYQ